MAHISVLILVVIAIVAIVIIYRLDTTDSFIATINPFHWPYDAEPDPVKASGMSSRNVPDHATLD